MKFNSTVTALITPFKEDDKLDEKGLIENINYQLDQGIDTLLVLGTTGESPTLSNEEQKRVIEIAVREAKAKAAIWVGTGAYSTQVAIEKTKQAKDLGAEAALIVTPYYNKPTQEGIYRHFEAISLKVEMPIVVYNIPGRCGVNIEVETLARIAQLPQVIGVKEASGNLNQVSHIIHTIVQKKANFAVFSGDDSLTLPMMALGAQGIISVVSNLVPSQVKAQVEAFIKGQINEAKKWHYKLLPLYEAAFFETNPIPIKAAMQLCGMPSGSCRLPLCEMKAQNLESLRQVLLNMQLLKEFSYV